MSKGLLFVLIPKSRVPRSIIYKKYHTFTIWRSYMNGCKLIKSLNEKDWLTWWEKFRLPRVFLTGWWSGCFNGVSDRHLESLRGIPTWNCLRQSNHQTNSQDLPILRSLILLNLTGTTSRILVYQKLSRHCVWNSFSLFPYYVLIENFSNLQL